MVVLPYICIQISLKTGGSNYPVNLICPAKFAPVALKNQIVRIFVIPFGSAIKRGQPVR